MPQMPPAEGLALCFAVACAIFIAHAAAAPVQVLTAATGFKLLNSNGNSMFSRPAWRRRRDAETTPHDHELQMSFKAHGKHFEYTLCQSRDIFATSAMLTGDTGERVQISAHFRPTTYSSCRGDSRPNNTATLTFIDSHTVSGVVRYGTQLFDLQSGESANGAHPELAVTQGARMRRSADGGPVAKWANCYTGDNTTQQVNIGMAISTKVKALFATTDQQLAYLQSLVWAANYYVFERQLNLRFTIAEVYVGTGKESWDTCMNIAEQMDRFQTWEAANEQGVALWHLIDDCYGAFGKATGYAIRSTLCSNKKRQFSAKFLDGQYDGRDNRGITYINGEKSALDILPNGGTWKTFTLELGLNMGAAHPFKDQSEHGKYGGIMDYGCSSPACLKNRFAFDARIDGEWQFNSATNRANICAELGSVIGKCSAVTPYTTVCGNGVQEDGEECECKDKTTSCTKCKSCKLEAGAKCSPDQAGFNGQCCESTGAFKTFATKCTFGKSSINAGYCANGRCNYHHDFCPRYKIGVQVSKPTFRQGNTGDEVCDTPTQGNDCRWACKLDTWAHTELGNCYDISKDFWDLSEGGGVKPGAAPNGNACRFEGDAKKGFGVCKAGTCVNATSDVPPPPSIRFATVAPTPAPPAPPAWCKDAASSGYKWLNGVDMSCGEILENPDITIGTKKPCEIPEFRKQCPASCFSCEECTDVMPALFQLDAQKKAVQIPCEEFALGKWRSDCSNSADITRRCQKTCYTGWCDPTNNPKATAKPALPEPKSNGADCACDDKGPAGTCVQKNTCLVAADVAKVCMNLAKDNCTAATATFKGQPLTPCVYDTSQAGCFLKPAVLACNSYTETQCKANAYGGGIFGSGTSSGEGTCYLKQMCLPKEPTGLCQTAYSAMSDASKAKGDAYLPKFCGVSVKIKEANKAKNDACAAIRDPICQHCEDGDTLDASANLFKLSTFNGGDRPKWFPNFVDCRATEFTEVKDKCSPTYLGAKVGKGHCRKCATCDNTVFDEVITCSTFRECRTKCQQSVKGCVGYAHIEHAEVDTEGCINTGTINPLTGRNVPKGRCIVYEKKLANQTDAVSGTTKIDQGYTCYQGQGKLDTCPTSINGKTVPQIDAAKVCFGEECRKTTHCCKPDPFTGVLRNMKDHAVVLDAVKGGEKKNPGTTVHPDAELRVRFKLAAALLSKKKNGHFGGTLTSTLTVNKDIDFTNWAVLDKFTQDFTKDIAAILKVAQKQIQVNAVTAGSVVVDFDVVPSDNGTAMNATVLQQAFSGPVNLPTVGASTTGAAVEPALQPTTTLTTTSVTTTTITTTITTTTTTPQAPDTGLSTGAIAGIVVGALLFFVVVGMCVLYCSPDKRAKRRKPKVPFCVFG